MRTLSFTCRPAMITNGSSDVRGICRVSSHYTRYDVYNDTDADQEAQVSLFPYSVRYVDSLYFGFAA